MIKFFDEEQKVVKQHNSLQKGDIIHVEYGDFDNWINFLVEEVFVSVNLGGFDTNAIGIKGYYVGRNGEVNGGNPITIYSLHSDDTYLVVGRKE